MICILVYLHARVMSEFDIIRGIVSDSKYLVIF